MFEDIGRAFCIGVLDFFNINPISRVVGSPYKDLEGVRGDLLLKNPIFIPKKKEEEKKEIKKLPKKTNQRSNSLVPKDAKRFN